MRELLALLSKEGVSLFENGMSFNLIEKQVPVPRIVST